MHVRETMLNVIRKSVPPHACPRSANLSEVKPGGASGDLMQSLSFEKLRVSRVVTEKQFLV